MTGDAKYTVDIRHDGQLEGAILRSKLAHARITELDLAPARALSGVGAVISLLADDRMVRYVGQPIAAVAAKDRKTALAAIAAIKVESERLPAVIGLDAARKPDAPVVFEKSSAARRPATCPRAAPAHRRPGTAMSEVRLQPSRRRRKRRAACSPSARTARNPLLVEETFRTATQSARFASSRTPPSPASMATA